MVSLFNNKYKKYDLKPFYKSETTKENTKGLSNTSEDYDTINFVTSFNQPKQRKNNPINLLTTNILHSYKAANPKYLINEQIKSKKCLTNPSEKINNKEKDNANFDLVVCVDDIIVNKDTKYIIVDLLGNGISGQVFKCYKLNKEYTSNINYNEEESKKKINIEDIDNTNNNDNIDNNEYYALKIIKSIRSYSVQALIEIKILEKINKEIDPEDKNHFIRKIDNFCFHNHICIVFELLNDNLFDIIKKNYFKGLTLKNVRFITRSILKAVESLHSNNLIHCDLKPENVLIKVEKNNSIKVKVTDFGISCDKSATQYVYLQSRYYRAPEVIVGNPYSTEIDIWSIGCIAAELFLGDPLFAGTCEYDQIAKIVDLIGPITMPIFNLKKFLKYFVINNNSNYNSINSTNIANNSLKLEKDYYNQYPKEKKETSNGFPHDIKCLEDIAKIKTKADPQEVEIFIWFLKDLLVMDPKKRLSAKKALNHPFITKKRITDEESLSINQTIGENNRSCYNMYNSCLTNNSYIKNSNELSLNNSFVNQSLLNNYNNINYLKNNNLTNSNKDKINDKVNNNNNFNYNNTNQCYYKTTKNTDSSFNYYGPYGGGFNVQSENNNYYTMSNNLYNTYNLNNFNACYNNYLNSLDNKQQNNNYNNNKVKNFITNNVCNKYNFNYSLNSSLYNTRNDIYINNNNNNNNNACEVSKYNKHNNSCFSINPDKIPYKAITNFPLVKVNEILSNNGKVSLFNKNYNKIKLSKYQNPNLNRTFTQEDNVSLLDGDNYNIVKKNKKSNILKSKKSKNIVTFVNNSSKHINNSNNKYNQYYSKINKKNSSFKIHNNNNITSNNNSNSFSNKYNYNNNNSNVQINLVKSSFNNINNNNYFSLNNKNSNNNNYFSKSPNYKFNKTNMFNNLENLNLINNKTNNINSNNRSTTNIKNNENTYIVSPNINYSFNNYCINNNRNNNKILKSNTPNRFRSFSDFNTYNNDYNDNDNKYDSIISISGNFDSNKNSNKNISFNNYSVQYKKIMDILNDNLSKDNFTINKCNNRNSNYYSKKNTNDKFEERIEEEDNNKSYD